MNPGVPFFMVSWLPYDRFGGCLVSAKGRAMQSVVAFVLSTPPFARAANGFRLDTLAIAR
jgi:hypothetical protein